VTLRRKSLRESADLQRVKGDADVQHTWLTSESSYFTSLEHVYHASTSRSLVAHNLDLRTTRDLPQLLQRVIAQFKNIAALSTAPGQVYTSYRAVPTSQVAQNIENIDCKNVAQVYQAAIVSPKVRCILSLHQTIGNPSNYRHVAAVRVDRSIRKGRPLSARRFIRIWSKSVGRIKT
jgi:Rps23 Pro-64 3,4-dihydroxylase Tpa1-like proline 4-hydroxylase